MITVTVLGCGSSVAVPAPGIGWGDCDPANPKNRRLRASILISDGTFNLLVDTGPDLREQLVHAGVNHVDAVFYTHEHADHTHGIDDLRGLWLKRRKSTPIYGDAKTLEALHARFNYLFTHGLDGAEAGRKVGVTPHVIEPTGELQIGPFTLKTFQQSHGRGTSLGLRLDDFSYSTDVSYLSKAARAVLAGTTTWIVDANNRRLNDTIKHSDVAQTLGWITELGVGQAWLTHLPGWHDYEALQAQCPANVQPAYDGLVLDIG